MVNDEVESDARGIFEAENVSTMGVSARDCFSGDVFLSYVGRVQTVLGLLGRRSDLHSCASLLSRSLRAPRIPRTHSRGGQSSDW